MVIRPKKGSVCFRLILLSPLPPRFGSQLASIKGAHGTGPPKKGTATCHATTERRHSALLTRRERKNLNKTTSGREKRTRKKWAPLLVVLSLSGLSDALFSLLPPSENKLLLFPSACRGAQTPAAAPLIRPTCLVYFLPVVANLALCSSLQRKKASYQLAKLSGGEGKRKERGK